MNRDTLQALSADSGFREQFTVHRRGKFYHIPFVSNCHDHRSPRYLALNRPGVNVYRSKAPLSNVLAQTRSLDPTDNFSASILANPDIGYFPPLALSMHNLSVLSLSYLLSPLAFQGPRAVEKPLCPRSEEIPPRR